MDTPDRPRGGVAIFPAEPGVLLFCQESQNVHALNGTAALIWSGLAEGLSREDILGALTESGAPAQEGSRWFADTLEMFRLNGLLEGTIVPPSPAVKVQGFGEGGTIFRFDAPPSIHRQIILPGARLALDLADDYLASVIDALFSRSASPSLGDDSATIRVSAGPDEARWLVLRDGRIAEEADSAGEIAAEIEAGLMRIVLEKADYLIAFRAALLSRDGEGLLLVGPTGSGKTMLAAGLIHRGWRFAGDELALFKPGEPVLRGVVKSLRVNRSGWSTLEPLYVQLADVPVYGAPGKPLKPLIPTGEIADVAPIKHIVVCRYRPASQSRLVSLPRHEGLQSLFGNCRAVSRPLTGADIQSLVAWSGGVAFHQLTAADLPEALDLLETMGRQGS